jgi:hypothetical protein
VGYCLRQEEPQLAWDAGCQHDPAMLNRIWEGAMVEPSERGKQGSLVTLGAGQTSPGHRDLLLQSFLCSKNLYTVCYKDRC